jgi:hypothetical protein
LLEPALFVVGGELFAVGVEGSRCAEDAGAFELHFALVLRARHDAVGS